MINITFDKSNTIFKVQTGKSKTKSFKSLKIGFIKKFLFYKKLKTRFK